MPHTILIVDDHDGFREGARQLLEAGGFVVVGEASDGQNALLEVERLRPDIVLLDIQIPELDGFAVAEHLAMRTPAPIVVLVSSREAVTYGGRVARASVAGFLPKWELSGASLADLVG